MIGLDPHDDQKAHVMQVDALQAFSPIREVHLETMTTYSLKTLETAREDLIAQVEQLSSRADAGLLFVAMDECGSLYAYSTPPLLSPINDCYEYDSENEKLLQKHDLMRIGDIMQYYKYDQTECFTVMSCKELCKVINDLHDIKHRRE